SDFGNSSGNFSCSFSRNSPCPNCPWSLLRPLGTTEPPPSQATESPSQATKVPACTPSVSRSFPKLLGCFPNYLDDKSGYVES
ncbi:MAG: hypothetical protein LBJ67_05580, partial [Planctomycetaceae bacterium]|nr:hypothetical protein [Planctomycetaceae bacterium]